MGVVVCCDTMKGVFTIEKLIELWEGEVLFIWIIQTFHNNLKQSILQSIEGLHQHLYSLCNNRTSNLPQCVIFTTKSNETIQTQQIVDSIPSGRLQFVYVDFYLSYSNYLQDLRSWFAKLSKGGVLMGSRLSPSAKSTQATRRYSPRQQLRQSCLESEVYYQYLHRNISMAPHQQDHWHRIRSAVETITYETHSAFLATYNEAMWSNTTLMCSSSLFSGECLPAWYIHKLTHWPWPSAT